jgi:hypothetical protein
MADYLSYDKLCKQVKRTEGGVNVMNRIFLILRIVNFLSKWKKTALKSSYMILNKAESFHSHCVQLTVQTAV